MLSALCLGAAVWATDGDSVRCDEHRLRLLGDGVPSVIGIDAPETHRPKCARERALGERAHARLSELLSVPGVAIQPSGAKDRWGRHLARVWIPVQGGYRTAGSILLAEGHARVWTPGSEANWC
ncbi:MAG: thermonuclease family protein [Pseudomonadota bacterium]